VIHALRSQIFLEVHDGFERHDPAIDLRADRAMTNISVDAVREVDRR